MTVDQKCIEDAKKHKEMAALMEEAYEYVKKHGNIPWSLVTAFYTALHYVDAVLRAKGELPLRHEMKNKGDKNARNRLVQRRISLAFFKYKKLFEYSVKARYEPSISLEYDSSHLKDADEALEKVVSVTTSELQHLLSD